MGPHMYSRNLASTSQHAMLALYCRISATVTLVMMSLCFHIVPRCEAASTSILPDLLTPQHWLEGSGDYCDKLASVTLVEDSLGFSRFGSSCSQCHAGLA